MPENNLSENEVRENKRETATGCVYLLVRRCFGTEAWDLKPGILQKSAAEFWLVIPERGVSMNHKKSWLGRSCLHFSVV
jgi:hypothetical protein